jgi:tetratricopeptide (TPR) repeat protein
LRRPADALRAFRQAVTLNPALLASWSKLAELYARESDESAAEHAREQLQRLRALPRELLSVASMLHEGRLYKAERLCRSFLKQNPRNVEGMRLLAELGVRLLVLDDAEFLLESAVEFEPDNLAARHDYVKILQKRQKYARALEEAETLRRRAPGQPAFELLFANQHAAIGDYDAALEIYDRMIAEHPGLPGTYLVRGHALKTVGRYEDAIDSYRSAISQRPAFGDAYWSLANLKTYRFPKEEIERMRVAEREPATGLVDRYHLCFALGKALEDRRQFDESFGYYERGNDLKRAETRYSPERIEREFRAQAETCDEHLFHRAKTHGCPAPDPIFIVGLPRAGSTLLEQILASHSQVDGTMELPNILALAHRLSGRRMVGDDPRYPGVLAELEPEQLREFGEKFIEDTRIHRSGAPYFIDKMPNNFRHIGLIHLILPSARIIDARREPMACCFSGFKQLFAEGQEFTYGLEEIGRYYRGYVELMDHWDRVLPGVVLRVRYEDVVSDLESQVRRILDFCGLPFEDNCVDFHRTARPVRTPSSEQVRQPIYTAGLEQWRHYEAHLGPLRDALGTLAS